MKSNPSIGNRDLAGQNPRFRLLNCAKPAILSVMSLPVITVAQMREWENATWASGQTEAAVIRRVGKCAAIYALKLTRPGDAILVLAGKGNNGSDARAAVEFLNDRKTEILNVASPENDLRKFQELLRQKFALIIDGLFGIGLNRPLDEHWIKLISAINETKIAVLAIDVPSGLNCETGLAEGAAVEAAVTLTVGAPKTGMLAQSAWPFVGRLEVLDEVGLVPCRFAAELNWTLPQDFENFPPRRPEASHKGSQGHLAIIAGSLGYHGASVLAARAAQRAQPGLITLFTDEPVYHVVAPQLQAVMVGVFKPDMKFPEVPGATLAGPGLHAPGVADAMRKMLQRLWRGSPAPVVVDASALDWLVPHSLPKGIVRVITPHPGEAGRLLNLTSKQVQLDRPRVVRELSKRFGNCQVVLKGHQTLVGCAEGEIFVNSSGNPFLAQGGSGDVLSGYIAGLLAQPSLQADAGKTLRFAVWQHGRTADALQDKGKIWTVEDLAGELGNER
jgi:ADP-dependent NAD(P)H-hydrate dehydratase / NAD(P)H-hydrate epimerase